MTESARDSDNGGSPDPAALLADVAAVRSRIRTDIWTFWYPSAVFGAVVFIGAFVALAVGTHAVAMVGYWTLAVAVGLVLSVRRLASTERRFAIPTVSGMARRQTIVRSVGIAAACVVATYGLRAADLDSVARALPPLLVAAVYFAAGRKLRSRPMQMTAIALAILGVAVAPTGSIFTEFLVLGAGMLAEAFCLARAKL